MLEWNVYVGNFNSGRIETRNVFSHTGLMDDLKKAARKYRDRERELFEEDMRRSILYWYWSKCEWEIILSHWPPRTDAHDEKIDVYDQVMLNWDVFREYVWRHRAELRKREKKDNRAE